MHQASSPCAISTICGMSANTSVPPAVPLFSNNSRNSIFLRPGYGRIVYLTYREPCVQGKTGGILHYLTVCILIPHHAVFAYPASARLKLRLYEYDCLCSFAKAFIYTGQYQLN